MFIYLNKKAQSTAEYVIVLGLIVAAVMAMQTYIKRGFNGRIAQAVDYTGPVVAAAPGAAGAAFDPGFDGAQFEPYYLTSDFANRRASNEGEQVTVGGAVARTLTEERSQRRGQQRIGVADETAAVVAASDAVDFAAAGVDAVAPAD